MSDPENDLKEAYPEDKQSIDDNANDKNENTNESEDLQISTDYVKESEEDEQDGEDHRHMALNDRIAKHTISDGSGDSEDEDGEEDDDDGSDDEEESEEGNESEDHEFIVEEVKRVPLIVKET